MASSATAIGTHRRTRTWRTGWIGIDLDVDSIRVAQIAQRRGAWQLLHCATLPWRAPDSANSFDDRSFADLKAVIADSASTFSGRRTACLLPNHLTQLRAMDLPHGSDDELRQMIAQELEHVHGESDDSVFDFWVSKADDARRAATDTVYVVSVDRRLADTNASLLWKAGLNCRVVDARPFALARLLRLHIGFDHDSADAIGVYDFSAVDTTLTVARHGLPVYSRVQRGSGFGAIVQSLIDGLGLSLPEAYEVIETCGVSSGDTTVNDSELRSVVSEITRQPIDDVLRELDRTIAYLRQTSSSHIPKRLVLTGAGAAMQGMDRLIADRVGIRTVPFEMPVSGDSASVAPFGCAAAMSALSFLS